MKRRKEMKIKIMSVLVFAALATSVFSAREVEPVKKGLPEIKKVEPVKKEEYSEEKSILNYIKEKGYKEKSELRPTMDITMDEGVKEIDAEKDGITYTLFVKANKEAETVEIVDELVKEYYDILAEVKKGDSRITSIDAATYAKGTDIIIYVKETISKEEYREIGRNLANRIKNQSPFIGNVNVLLYHRFNTEKHLFQEKF